MNSDQIQSVARTVLKVAGGFLVAKGVTDEGTWTTISGGVLALAGLIWSHFHHQ